MRRVSSLSVRLRRVSPRTVDVGVAVALVVAVAAGDTSSHPPVAVWIVSLMVPMTVVFRRRAPAVATLLAVAGAVVVDRLGGEQQIVLPVVLALDCYLIGLHSPERRSLVDPLVLLLPLLAIATSPNVSLQGAPKTVAVLWVWGFFAALPFIAGRVVGTRVRMNSELRANAHHLEREQRERASLVSEQERARIARELHDVVAHSVSVMVIQTAAARRVGADDPTSAREALQAVETCGRDALIDLRRMIGVLERSDFEVLGGSLPGLAQLGKLAERARASGLVVELCVEGHSRPLPPALDLVSFRIVQEALTNAIKHAGPAQARVRVTFTDDDLELEISDTGRGPSRWRPSPNAGGLGLVGMQERLALYGGHLQTGPRRGGGFEVQARLPLTEPAGKG